MSQMLVSMSECNPYSSGNDKLKIQFLDTEFIKSKKIKVLFRHRETVSMSSSLFLGATHCRFQVLKAY